MSALWNDAMPCDAMDDGGTIFKVVVAKSLQYEYVLCVYEYVPYSRHVLVRRFDLKFEM